MSMYHKIVLDLQHMNRPFTQVVERDSLRGLEITAFADGKSFNPAGYVPSLWTLAAGSKTPARVEGTVDSNGKILIPIDSKMLTPGLMTFQVKLRNDQGGSLRFPSFPMEIDHALDYETGGENPDSLWEKLYSELEQARAEAVISAAEATEAKSRAEACQIQSCACAAASLESKTAAEEAKTEATAAKEAAETARSAAESAQSAAEDAQSGANAAKISADQSASNAWKSKTAAESAANRASEANEGAKAAKLAAESAKDAAAASAGEAENAATNAAQSKTEASQAASAADSSKIAAEQAKQDAETVKTDIQAMKTQIDGIANQVSQNSESAGESKDKAEAAKNKAQEIADSLQGTVDQANTAANRANEAAAAAEQVANKVIPNATKTSKGIVQIGDGINVTPEGVISVPTPDLSQKADLEHTHSTSDIEGLDVALEAAGKVKSVNGKTGKVEINAVPEGGEEGQVLKKTADGYEWGQDEDTQPDLTPYAKSEDMQTALSAKVDKEENKGLSTHDYDDTAKAKVDAIPANPLYTDTVTRINGKTGEIGKDDIVALGIPKQDTTYNAATTSANGLMSAVDKTAVNGIGNRLSLNTTNKSSIVAAINEVNSRCRTTWVGTQAQYNAVSKNASTLYLIYE